jgi:hypothetical protein
MWDYMARNARAPVAMIAASRLDGGVEALVVAHL